MDPVFGLDSGRLLAHGGQFTADEFGRLALLSLPVLGLFVAFIWYVEFRQWRRTDDDVGGRAAVQPNASARGSDGVGSRADPS